MIVTADLEKLARFLVKAKIVTYAAGNDEYAVTPILGGSHQLEYLDGNLLYRDIYYGGLHFIGMETVFQDQQPFWGMSYYGGVLPDSDDLHIAGMSPVLKAALREVPRNAPYRGPKSFRMGDYIYKNKTHGDIMSFHGTEIIRIQEQTIYQLRYSGGVVK